jgi:hypothetical protein
VGAVGVRESEDIFLREVWVRVKKRRKGRASLLIFVRVARGKAWPERKA